MDSAGPIPGSQEDRDPTRFEEAPHPTLNDAIRAFLGDADLAGLTPYKVEIGLLASQEVTYKVWTKELDETIGGTIFVG